MKKQLLQSIDASIKAVTQLREQHALVFIEGVAALIARCFNDGHKVIIAGNGGSLCDANHFAEELTGYFRHRRRALPVISLSDPGHLTCVGNDDGFEFIFSRGVEAYGQPGDVFVGMSTSGNSKNIIKAFEVAQSLGLYTVAFLGKGGGQLKEVADLELIIDGFDTSDRIQEAHMTAAHIIIEMIEYFLFPQLVESYNETVCSPHT